MRQFGDFFNSKNAKICNILPAGLFPEIFPLLPVLSSSLLWFMKLLILGGGGFLSGALTRQALAAGSPRHSRLRSICRTPPCHRLEIRAGRALNSNIQP